MTPKFRNPGIHDNSCILKSSFQNFTPLIGISPKSACSHRWETPFHNIFDFFKKNRAKALAVGLVIGAVS